MMQRDPRWRRWPQSEQRIEQRPVGHGVGAVALASVSRFGLAQRAAVEMIAPMTIGAFIRRSRPCR